MVGADGTGVAIVTVSHDSGPDLERLMETVERHLPGARMVVVDSGSSDGGGPDAARAWKGGAATVIELEENLGYGRATNRGVAQVEEPVTVVANPDIELLDSSLAALGAEAARPGSPERILAPLVLLPDGSRQDNAQRAPTSAAMALAALIPPVAWPPPVRPLFEPWCSGHALRVSWAVGCCLVARTDTLRRLGPFDERIFLYAEDTELGLRAGQQGIETWFWPDARVVHHQAHSTNAAFGGENVELLARQRRAVIQERLGAGRRRLDDAIQLATFANRIALKALVGRPNARERSQLAALRRVRREPPRLT